MTANKQQPQAAAVDTSAPSKAKRSRIDEIRERRKQRQSQDVSGYSQRLSVPEEFKDKQYVYRWANDVATRVHDLKARDWEVVSSEDIAKDERNTGVGTTIERIGSARTVTTPEKTVLMRKYKEFYDEDEERKQVRIKQNEEGLIAGKTGDPQGLTGPEAYVPQGGISIKHGR